MKRIKHSINLIAQATKKVKKWQLVPDEFFTELEDWENEFTDENLGFLFPDDVELKRRLKEIFNG